MLMNSEQTEPSHSLPLTSPLTFVFFVRQVEFRWELGSFHGVALLNATT